MALRKPIPSPETRKAFRDGLAKLIRLGRAPTDLPPEDYPQQIYAIGLNDIVSGRGIRAARPVAWEFLVGSILGPAVSVYVGRPPKGSPPRTTSLSRPLSIKALKATQEVEKLPEVQAHNYELRRLRIARTFHRRILA